MCSVWIVFAFGDMSGSLSGFVVSCPSRFWFSSSFVSFLSTVALSMPLIAYGLALSVISYFPQISPMSSNTLFVVLVISKVFLRKLFLHHLRIVDA